MKLWLIRHTRGDIEDGICYGSSDILLPASFEADARPLLAAIVDADAGDSDMRVYSSPLQRCARLAKRIAAPVLDSRLQEMNFGAWEFKPWSDVDRSALDQWAADPLGWRIPGGESVRDMAGRVRSFLDEMKSLPVKRACVVTHGGVLRMLCAHLWQRPLEDALNIPVPFGSGLNVRWNGRARLLKAHGWDKTALPGWMR